MKTGVPCTNCAKTTTRHPSGICARCRNKADIPMRLCKCCEARRTRDSSGMCYKCRNKSIYRNYDISRIDEAIARCETTLQVLKLKAAGRSYREISAAMQIPKSTVSNIFVMAAFSGAHGSTFEK